MITNHPIHTIHLKTKQQHCPIYIGENILQQSCLLSNHIREKQVLIVSNQTIAPFYLKNLISTLHDYTCNTVILPEGEHYKDLDTLKRIFTELTTHHHHRTTTLIALGGGVIGDMTGFAAACYCRGVNYIQIPTTLLAQVDSAIGGKTGVNYQSGKNLIGAFHHPQCVLIDIATLTTLPDREFKSGLTEVIKYGLIMDAKFFSWLENNIQNILEREPNALLYMIQQSCQIKANIVTVDEKDQGIRSLLNLGHTFGHAIESGTQYKQYRHGEAVALGIRIATIISIQKSWLSQDDGLRIQRLLDKIGMSDSLPKQLSFQKMLELMQLDKKQLEKNIADQQLRVVLLKKIGEAEITDQFNQGHLQKFMEADRLTG